MTAVRAQVPRQIGPYAVLARLDDGRSALYGPPPPVPERRYLARSTDGRDTVLVSQPLPGADPELFAAEAEMSRYLLGAWASSAVWLAGPGEAPWHAAHYVPALPLPTALSVLGRPLPEDTVRVLGSALADTLGVVHGQGLAHAGISPAAVLLTADGLRLTCFGAVRAAAPDGAPRHGLPGLESGSLPPEQAAGEHPQPAGDIYALGATLAYAATGHTVPERGEIPPGLRGVLTACLTRDPAERPGTASLLDAFGAHEPGPGWLPPRVVAALARQSAVLLAADVPPDLRTTSPGAAAPAGAGPGVGVPADAAASPSPAAYAPSQD